MFIGYFMRERNIAPGRGQGDVAEENHRCEEDWADGGVNGFDTYRTYRVLETPAKRRQNESSVVGVCKICFISTNIAGLCLNVP